jgi:zinc protease
LKGFSMKLLKLFAVLGLGFIVQTVQAGPKIEHWVATSGAKVFFVENHALPILDVQVDFAAGTAYDPVGKTGLASMTRGLLELGAKDMDETQIASRMADLGGRSIFCVPFSLARSFRRRPLSVKRRARSRRSRRL